MVGLYLGGMKTVYLLPSHEGIIFKKKHCMIRIPIKQVG